MARSTKDRPDYLGRFSAPVVAGTSGAAYVPDTCSENNVEVDIAEVYFLIMHFLSSGPCQRAFVQLSNDVLLHKLLPRRFHVLPSRGEKHAVDEGDDGMSSPLSYANILVRWFFWPYWSNCPGSLLVNALYFDCDYESKNWS